MFFKRMKLENQMIREIKSYAHVKDFPSMDAQYISKALSGYNKGGVFVELSLMQAMSTIEKYPDLYNHWDALMIKYKKLGLFPNWNIVLSIGGDSE